MVSYGWWSLTGSFNNNNLTDEGTNRDLVRWSLKRGGRLREVVAQGGSTVVELYQTSEYQFSRALIGY